LTFWPEVGAADTVRPILRFEPASQTIGFGNIAQVAVGLSDLATIGSPSVGAFDLAVQFDPNILSFVDLKFAPYLGDPADPTQTISDISLFENKVVLFAEVSLLTIDDLDGLQASFEDSFLPLAHLSFMGVGPCRSPLQYTRGIVGDGAGDPIAVSFEEGNIEVPEPGSLLFICVGLGLLGACRHVPTRLR
jgi:hypothetical protein